MADTQSPSTSAVAQIDGAPPSGLLDPLTGPGYGGGASRVRAFLAQPAVRKSLPMAVGLLAVSGAIMLYFAMASGPQRVLYSNLSDGERSEVVDALDKGGIAYTIDNGTGALTVGEDDLYRARMLVASDGGLAAPETTAQMLDAIPIGSSRTLEGERLRNVREQELTRTIMEIDGVEAVRVHLAQAERSVFVRESSPPSASVMVRMARGRGLNDDQVNAIVNLVAGSVPAMTSDTVRVVDQNGQLLSDKSAAGGTALEMQRGYEDKMRAQVAQLLVPMLGEGNFSTEVQVELDLDDTTSARESYEKEGAVRSEINSQSTQSSAGAASGVPGVLANTPPPATQLAPPGEDAQAAPAATGPISGETRAQRTYELGREVAVSTKASGGVKRISVAVAISAEALEKIKPASAEQIEKLVGSAVGANVDRGDAVTVVTGTFDPVIIEEPAFYETGWFATVLRNAVALIAVILALLFGVRPLVRAIGGRTGADTNSEDEEDSENTPASAAYVASDTPPNPALLREQVGLAQKLAAEQPDRAVEALRRMLAAPQVDKAA